MKVIAFTDEVESRRIHSAEFDFPSEASKVVITEGITSIPDSASYDCYRIAEIEFPPTLVTIGSRAFSNCTYLTRVIIPGSVRSIGRDVFSRCENLRNL